MAITASKLREDVYNILDRVLETGEPVTIAATAASSRSCRSTRRASSIA